MSQVPDSPFEKSGSPFGKSVRPNRYLPMFGGRVGKSLKPGGEYEVPDSMTAFFLFRVFFCLIRPKFDFFPLDFGFFFFW